jgi:lipopolysaccharide transport system permease protein
VPSAIRPFYALNPMVGVIEGFRWSLLGVGRAPGLTTLVSAAMAFLLFIAACLYFRRLERSFADVI